jgi:hypothetical protein
MKRDRTGGFRHGGIALVGCVLAVSFAGCDPFGLRDLGSVSGTPLERDLAKTLPVEGRVECTLYVDARDLWRCRVESDPGSGFSGNVYLRLNEDGCWRARHVRFERRRNSETPRSGLSVGDMHPFGRTLKGCTELE